MFRMGKPWTKCWRESIHGNPKSGTKFTTTQEKILTLDVMVRRNRENRRNRRNRENRHLMVG